MARGAFRVRAVARQQDANVHLICLGLEPGEKSPYAVPDVFPPFAFAFDDPRALIGVEFAPRNVERNAAFAREAHQIRLAFLVGLGLPRLDRARCQAQRRIRDHQVVVDADVASESAAGLARADRRIETEVAGARILVSDLAIRAMQAGRETPRSRGFTGIRLRICVEPALAEAQTRLDRVADARRLGGAPPQAVLHDLQNAVARLVDAAIALPLEQSLDFRFGKILRNADRESQHQSRVAVLVR